MPSGNILISDSTYGLFVVKEAADTGTPPITPPPLPPAPTPTDMGGNGGGSSELPLLIFGIGLLLYRRRKITH